MPNIVRNKNTKDFSKIEYNQGDLKKVVRNEWDNKSLTTICLSIINFLLIYLIYLIYNARIY